MHPGAAARGVDCTRPIPDGRLYTRFVLPEDRFEEGDAGSADQLTDYSLYAHDAL